METPSNPPATKPRWSGLGTRVLGILPLLVVAVVSIIYGGWLFMGFITACGLIMLSEWYNLTRKEGVALKLVGMLLIIAACIGIVWLEALTAQDEYGPPVKVGRYLLFYLICAIAATDILAYFTGKRFGKHKLAPVISPNKTWEGLMGGIVGSIAMAMVFMPALPLYIQVPLGLSVTILAQSGDLFESSVKRKAGVKDSGTLIPGHGGLLDRFDGYLLTAPVFALLIYAFAS